MTEALPVLYWANGSIPSWMVMIALYDKSIPFEARRLKVMSTPRETRSEEFLAINPRGQTPTWVESDGTTVVESMAILHYLENTRPHHALLPKDPAPMALTLSRLYAVENLRKVYRPLEQLFFPLQGLTHHQKEAAQKALEKIPAELSIWEHAVSQTPFVAGPTFTLADCAFYATLAYQQRRGLDLQHFPALKQYTDRLEKRPSIQRARPEGWDQGKAKNLFARARSLKNA